MDVAELWVTKTICEKYAKLLVNYSLSLKKGDKFCMTSSYLAEDLLKEMYKQAVSIQRVRRADYGFTFDW